MTRVSERKTKLSFETDAEVRTWGTVTENKVRRRRPVYRSIIIDVDNGWHGSLRLKGTRQKFEFSWEGLYQWAAEQEAHRRKAERKKQTMLKGAR